MTFYHWIAWFYWNPPREAFRIPVIDHPVVWYGILFVTGFILSYFLINPIFARFLSAHGYPTPKETAYQLTDRLCWFVVAGTLIGARLGAVFFYDWELYRQHPMEILKIWHGGLASHGGVIGVMIALYAYLKITQKQIPQLTFLYLLDFVAIPSALVAFFIRMGNFMNQEILGTPTTLPWGVVFGHPADGSFPTPRHPIQLYEGFAYLLTFVVLWQVWKRQKADAPPGKIVGLLFIFIFGSRFILEFWKTTQESIIDASFLQMGQWLSVPFVLLGAYLALQTKLKKT